MCLILFSYKQHPRYPLIFAANRDEFYGRPASPLAFWDEAPDLLAGRDLKGGGTWLGLSRTGRWAGVTNYREGLKLKADAPSRGHLITRYLRGNASPEAYLTALDPPADAYNGFNMLLGDTEGLYYFSNRQEGIHRLEPGLYGLSNHLLDTPWPKVVRGKEALRAHLDGEVINPETLLPLLADTAMAADDLLPETGVGIERERVLSSMFIKTPMYGTRASTVFLIDNEGKGTIIERTFPTNGDPAFETSFSLNLTSALHPSHP